MHIPRIKLNGSTLTNKAKDIGRAKLKHHSKHQTVGAIENGVRIPGNSERVTHRFAPACFVCDSEGVTQSDTLTCYTFSHQRQSQLLLRHRALCAVALLFYLHSAPFIFLFRIVT